MITLFDIDTYSHEMELIYMYYIANGNFQVSESYI